MNSIHTDFVTATKDKIETLADFAHKEAVDGRMCLEKFLACQSLKNEVDELNAILSKNKVAIDFFRFSSVVHEKSKISRDIMQVFEKATKTAVAKKDWKSFELIYETLQITGAPRRVNTTRQMDRCPYIGMLLAIRCWKISREHASTAYKKSAFQIMQEKVIFGLAEKHEGLAQDYSGIFVTLVDCPDNWTWVGQVAFQKFWNADVKTTYERKSLMVEFINPSPNGVKAKSSVL